MASDLTFKDAVQRTWDDFYQHYHPLWQAHELRRLEINNNFIQARDQAWNDYHSNADRLHAEWAQLSGKRDVQIKNEWCRWRKEIEPFERLQADAERALRNELTPEYC